MFLNKYLNSMYLDLIYNNYSEEYIDMLDENNFNKIYNLLKDKGFYFIDDIILDYLELFEIDYNNVAKALEDIKLLLGENYINKIGNNMILIDRIIDIALSYR